LGIDIFSGDFIFDAVKSAKSETIAEYFAKMSAKYEQKGIKELHIFFDQNPTHKNKMQDKFKELTQHLHIKTEFHFIASYSPKLNLVEYAIHLIRQKVLHHADCQKNLADFEKEIRFLCETGSILTKEQILNILDHIRTLV
jgi:transposase